jgi:Mn2+/Fe2+ NRAMP family transporter
MSPSPLQRLLRAFGPGLITGAADDDPSGIATYSQAGAQFGYGMLWTVFLTLPFMAAIQIISARIGWTTRKGLTLFLAAALPAPVLYLLIAALVVANTINIAADLAAMGEALWLVTGGSSLVFAALFGAACLIAEIFIPYHRYAGYLKGLTLILLCYVAAAFSVSVSWRDVAYSAFVPNLVFDKTMLLMVVAVFGTTISPYLFFWQASQEAEESRLSHRKFYHAVRPTHAHALRSISIDTWTGMIASNVVAFFIIVTTAVTLNANGITHIETASQAAEALRPIGGPLTFALFAAGIIGTGMLAVPVLAGSAAYAVAELFKIHGSLELPASRAVGFYSIVSAATIGGGALLVTNIDPITMLFWSAVINGIVAVPIMASMMIATTLLRDQHRIELPPWLKIVGWLSVLLMSGAAALLIASSF